MRDFDTIMAEYKALEARRNEIAFRCTDELWAALSEKSEKLFNEMLGAMAR